MRTSLKTLTVIAAVVAVAAIGAAAAFAQGPDQAPPFAQGFVDEDGDGVCDICGQTPGSGYGMMGRSGAQGAPWAFRGTMGANSIIALLADKLELTVPEIQAELAGGQSIAEFAEANGLDAEALVQEVLDAREEALLAAVDAGWRTAEQVEWMLDHMAEELNEHIEAPWSGPGGYGPGGCQGGAYGQASGAGGRFGGGMMRGFGFNSGA